MTEPIYPKGLFNADEEPGMREHVNPNPGKWCQCSDCAEVFSHTTHICQ